MSDSYKIYASQEYVDNAIAENATTITSVNDSAIQWSNSSGYLSPVAQAMHSETSVNKLAFADLSGVAMEYSWDNGVTWSDHSEVSDNDRKSILTKLVSYSSIMVGRGRNSINPPQLTRITLNLEAMGVRAYGQKCFTINTAVQNASALLNGYIIVESASEDNPETFTHVLTQSLAVGYNTIVLPQIFDTQPSPKLRFIFGVNETYYSIMWIDGLSLHSNSAEQSGASNMAITGHLYNYDADQNATFPAAVSATSLRLTDSVTGTQYTLTIQNGELVISP